jgi:hypothetical protein
MNKADKKMAMSGTIQGMLLAQEMIERAKNRRELMLAESMYHAFWALELLYKDAGIEPEGRY